jgi:hypothetical protein
MFAARRRATDGVDEGVDASALRSASVEGRDGVVADDELVLELVSAAWSDAVCTIGTVVVATAAIALEALVDVAEVLENANVVGVAKIGRAMNMRAEVERMTAASDAPTVVATADRREETGRVRRNNVATVPLKCCPCAFIDSILRDQYQGGVYEFSTPGQLSRRSKAFQSMGCGGTLFRSVPS